VTRGTRGWRAAGVLLAVLWCWSALWGQDAVKAYTLGRLHWGSSPSGTAWTDVSLARAMAKGDEPALHAGESVAQAWVDSGKSFRTVSRISVAGYLPGQPEYEASVSSLQEMKTLVPLALCARGGAETLRVRCEESASEGVFAWMRAYAQPTGNPIDESNLLPLLLATDLLEATWNGERRAEARAWLLGFLAASDRYWRTVLNGPNNTPYSNFESWRLMLATLAAKISGERDAVAGLTVLWHQQVESNVGSDGRTYDLRRRGALHYQVYDLEPMLWTRMFAPEVFSAQDDGLIEGAVMYLKPYVEGTKTNVEFAHPEEGLGPAIAFDKTRRDAGLKGYQWKNWDPADGRLALHLAAQVYAPVAAWYADDREASYAVMVREIVRLQR
jgi:hypothetical protein